MSKKLKYKIISCSSQQSEFPSSSLLFGGQNGGWQTKRFCTYPQEVTFEFYGPVKIDKIEIVSDNRKIPSQVDILFYMPFNGPQAEERFQKYGYLNFNRNQNSQLKQHKSIMVDIRCLYLRFLLHKPHPTKQNFFSQIGIQQITIFGNDTNSTFAPLQKLPRQLGESYSNMGDYGVMDEDPFVSQKLAILTAQKQRAVDSEDFQSANQYKQIIETVKKAGEQLRKLQVQKRLAIQQQDYEKANNIKKSIQKHRIQLDELISFGEQNNFQYQQEENQFLEENQPLNDMHDNQFAQNDIITKSRLNDLNNRGQTSRINLNGNGSRIKINKSIMLRKENQRQKENYDDRVIPTLASGNKLKTQESQLLEQPEDKKIELKLDEIDGKYIQYSIILLQHFQEDTVKRFFSQYWQHKVEALTAILNETKKKPNPSASFVKCLLVVVKNSVSETNFQVAMSSLQLFNDLLKVNAKGNLLTRTNQFTNDLDAISKQIIKKMTDNNNKIKLQAQKVITQMINSSLYGPEVCVIAMTKTKEKVKLSSKQLLSRLNGVKKITQKNANNQQINAIASDFAVQNINNPSSEVRNQAMNLLLLCRENDSSGMVEKKISEKNLSQLIETYESKTESKGNQKLSKSKKVK